MKRIKTSPENEKIWEEFLDIDLTEAFKRVAIPYVILQGNRDLITSKRELKESLLLANNSKIILKTNNKGGHVMGGGEFK